tara:strand:- start:2419 stop:2712 length:294 start_codon:yes stop_codon:yes gene_type:complete
MEDGRKNNGGNKNAGRKPKADEIKLIEQMDAVLVPLDVWKALATKIESGDMLAAKTWLQYRYGMPKQVVEQTNLNIEQKDLTAEEIKLIKDNINDTY